MNFIFKATFIFKVLYSKPNINYNNLLRYSIVSSWLPQAQAWIWFKPVFSNLCPFLSAAFDTAHTLFVLGWNPQGPPTPTPSSSSSHVQSKWNNNTKRQGIWCTGTKSKAVEVGRSKSLEWSGADAISVIMLHWNRALWLDVASCVAILTK